MRAGRRPRRWGEGEGRVGDDLSRPLPATAGPQTLALSGDRDRCRRRGGGGGVDSSPPSRAAIASFAEGVEEVAGAARLEVTCPGGLSEELLGGAAAPGRRRPDRAGRRRERPSPRARGRRPAARCRPASRCAGASGTGRWRRSSRSGHDPARFRRSPVAAAGGAAGGVSGRQIDDLRRRQAAVDRGRSVIRRGRSVSGVGAGGGSRRRRGTGAARSRRPPRPHRARAPRGKQSRRFASRRRRSVAVGCRGGRTDRASSLRRADASVVAVQPSGAVGHLAAGRWRAGGDPLSPPPWSSDATWFRCCVPSARRGSKWPRRCFSRRWRSGGWAVSSASPPASAGRAWRWPASASPSLRWCVASPLPISASIRSWPCSESWWRWSPRWRRPCYPWSR